MRLFNWSRKTLFLGLISVIVLAVSGLAIAQTSENQGPRTDKVDSAFELNVVKQNAKQCQGQDGQYTEQVNAVYQGRSESQDERLRGFLTLTVDSLVRQNPKFPKDLGTTGTADGHFKLTETPNGRVKAEGNFYATIEGDTPASPTRILGTVVGRVTQNAQDVGGTLVGSFRASASPDGSRVVGTFGGPPGEVSLPAVIQQGSCPGPAGT